MALANYADLLAAVADELERTDLTSKIPDWVLFFEALCNYGDNDRQVTALRTRDMETTSSGNTLTDGAFSLASGFLEMKRITCTSNPRVPLTYVSPDALDEMYPTTDTGTPRVYTIIGSSVLVRPTSTDTFEYIYVTKVPPLVTNSTNWLLSAYPQAYLYGTLHYAHVYLKNPEAALAMLSLAKSALGGLVSANSFNRAGNFTTRASVRAW